MSDQSTAATVEYKDIQGFLGYRVGDDGSVWSRLPQVRGGGPLLDEWRRLKSVGRRGYPRVGLRSHVGSRLHWRSIHRLVLEAFVGPCPLGMECCHEDGDRSNNVLSNLRWDTPAGNCEDSKRLGRYRIGSRHQDAKLTEELIPLILARVAAGESRRSIARSLRVCHGTIDAVVNGKSWKHVL